MVTTIIIFIVILALLVLAHEFGHFIVARYFGCQVDEFGFGFPPRIFGVQKGKTLYSLNWLPFGGFVKIKGENGEQAVDEDSFGHKSASKRVLILAAGVIMNILVAVVLMQIVMGAGVQRRITGPVDPSATVTNHQSEVVMVVEGGAASAVGIEAGDLLIELEGVEGNVGVAQLHEVAAQDPDKARKLVVERDGMFVNYTINAMPIPDTDQVGFGIIVDETGVVSYPVHVALYKGVTEVWNMTTGIFEGLGGLIRRMIAGESVGEAVAGPVGIAVITGEVAQLGFVALLQFMAFLSVNLAIINILPIPALDGGRILFVLIEKIRGGKPVRAQIEGIVHMIGFVLLIGLIILVTYRDIVRLVN